MKKTLLAVILLLVFILTFNCFAAEVKMSDVDYNSELGKSIDKLVKGGVVSGIPQDDGTYKFEAENFVTRAEFCKMVNVTFGFEIMADNIFKDVYKDQWYYVYVLPAIHAGYIQGYGNGLFGPTDYITREQVCVILSRITEAKAVENKSEEGAEKAEDKEVVIKDKVSDWARPYVENVISKGYISLEEGNTFRATENMTRGELAFALDDFVEIKEEASEGNTSDKSNTVDISIGVRDPGSSGGGSGNSSSGSGSSGDSTDTPDPEPEPEDPVPEEPTPEVEYTITYELNGMGELPEGARTTFTASTWYLLPVVKNLDMYIFKGWYTDPLFEGEPIKAIQKGTTGNQTYYANWVPRYTDEELQASESIYSSLEFVKYDIEEKEELEVFEFDEKGMIIFNHLKTCSNEVLDMRETGLVVSNQYVRSRYVEEIREITTILDGMTVEERDSFELEINKMNTVALKDLVDLFDVNINYGK